MGRGDKVERSFNGPRKNERIRVPEVRVIDAEGTQLGIMRTARALERARVANLDLVEINPKASPPVCKILDYGKYLYDKKKQESESRRNRVVVDVKEVRMRPKTDDHDMEVVIKKTRRFLEDGNKVKVTCRFRGREVTHPETARRQLDRVYEAVSDVGTRETLPRIDQRTMTMLLAAGRRPQKGK